MELRGGCLLNSEDSTSVKTSSQPAQSQENLSVFTTQQWEICKERNEQGIAIAHGENGLKLLAASADRRGGCSINAGAESLDHSEPNSEEASPGELILLLAPKQRQALIEHHRGFAAEQTHEAIPYLLEESTTIMEPSAASSQTSLTIHSSTMILRDGPLVSDLGVTEMPGNHTAGRDSSPWSLAQKSESDQTKPHPSSGQSVDVLPTFTSQRLQELPTTMGNTRNINTVNPVKQRYGAILYELHLTLSVNPNTY